MEYVDALGRPQVQRARTVILAYTFENVRLLFLSGDDRRPDGLGNTTNQLGKHFMSKMFPTSMATFLTWFSTGNIRPAAQAVVLDDFLDASFDCGAHGFLGGSTLGAENQFLPIQISRETLPPDRPPLGAGVQGPLRQWQHWGVVRMQPEALSYEDNYLDIDPRHRDHSGFDAGRARHVRLAPQRGAAGGILRGDVEGDPGHGRHQDLAPGHVSPAPEAPTMGGCRMVTIRPRALSIGTFVHDTWAVRVFWRGVPHLRRGQSDDDPVGAR